MAVKVGKSRQRWEPVAVHRVEDVSYGTPGALRTHVLYRKPNGKHKVKSKTGHWTLEELNRG